MGFESIRDMVDRAYGEGRTQYITFRKVPGVGSFQSSWVDLSMASGNPRPNYYSSTELTAAVKQGSMGIYHGGAVSPMRKFLHTIGIASMNAGVVPATFVLYDLLLYYPLIDMDSDAEQLLFNHSDNPAIPELPRYADGRGVKVCVVATTPYVGGPAFNLNYTNELGVSGRTSAGIATNVGTFSGTIIHSGAITATRGPFVDLAPHDLGVRSVESITFVSAVGGLAAIVLLKPIAPFHVREITTWCEYDFIRHRGGLPEIQDGAYLNLLCMPNGSVALQPIIGEATFIWG